MLSRTTVPLRRERRMGTGKEEEKGWIKSLEHFSIGFLTFCRRAYILDDDELLQLS